MRPVAIACSKIPSSIPHRFLGKASIDQHLSASQNPYRELEADAVQKVIL